MDLSLTQPALLAAQAWSPIELPGWITATPTAPSGAVTELSHDSNHPTEAISALFARLRHGWPEYA